MISLISLIFEILIKEGEIYYGQLRGFLTDQFGDKSGVIR